MNNKPFAGVICHGWPEIGHAGCGEVDLTKEQYMDQMMRPDSFWRCPNCLMEAEFNDDRYEELQGIS